jgi:predicted nucleic acid-binding protein
MSLIVDASVGVKWFAEEIGSERAESLLASAEPLWAPDLLLLEIGNALRKKVRAHKLSRAQATRAMEIAPEYFDRLWPIQELTAPASRLALELDHPIYDCVYLALAARENAPLITADERLFGIAGRAKVDARLL